MILLLRRFASVFRNAATRAANPTTLCRIAEKAHPALALRLGCVLQDDQRRSAFRLAAVLHSGFGGIMAAVTPKHLLAGYKVLDFTHFVAGPTATRLMAGMGAEVIKVELAPDGDQARTVEFIRDGRSAYFVQQNRGKLGICVDMHKPAALALIKELIPKVDVVIENFAPGIIASMGLDYATVSALNPRVIMCSISTF